MEHTLDRDDTRPVYNIKAVSSLLGLLPVTLRAWERRYGIPNPHRGPQGYRLYSERDLSVLHWLKTQIESGMSIGRAVQYLHELRQAERDPADIVTANLTPRGAPTTLDVLSGEFQDRLLSLDESRAAEVLRRSFSLFSVDEVLTKVISPTMVNIGEMWHRGELPIAVEHFASQHTMQQLMSMLSASSSPSRPGLIVAACAPGESHQIGLLMLVVMLRWRGWDIRFLGPDLILDRLEEALRPARPTLLMFTANREETARNLTCLSTVLERFPEPRPLVVVGGHGFDTFRLPDALPVIYLTTSPAVTIRAIEELMVQRSASNHRAK
jgi:DNA-binding transcriptional MerR regulator